MRVDILLRAIQEVEAQVVFLKCFYVRYLQGEDPSLKLLLHPDISEITCNSEWSPSQEEGYYDYYLKGDLEVFRDQTEFSSSLVLF